MCIPIKTTQSLKTEPRIKGENKIHYVHSAYIKNGQSQKTNVSKQSQKNYVLLVLEVDGKYKFFKKRTL